MKENPMRKPPQVLPAVLLMCFVLLTDAKPQSNSGTDPTVPGPHQVLTAEYNFGDSAAVVPGFPGPVEMRGSVTYPADLAGSVHPLIVFLHGRHDTRFQETTALGVLPCPAGHQPITGLQG